MGGQVGRVFTHWIVGKFVESDGAKGALGPAFFAMAARLTREVGRTQVANGQVKRKRGAAHFNKCAAPLLAFAHQSIMESHLLFKVSSRCTERVNRYC